MEKAGTIQGGSSSAYSAEYRPIGQTALRVSSLGFGASPLGDVFRETDQAEGITAVHYAIDQGINYFDVSPYYGLTVAETRLGKALDGYRDRVVLATKCGRYKADSFDFSAERIVASVEESLLRLQTDYIDLFQAHDVEFGHAEQIVEETIPAMRRLQEQGKVRYVGTTGYSLANLVKIASQAPVDSILTYCRYNLMITDMARDLVPFAREKGIGLINASAFHMGILTERGAPSWHPAPPKVLEAGKQIVDFCKRHGVNASEVALRYCFDLPDVASTLVGMSTRDHVEANLKCGHMTNDPSFMAQLQKLAAPVKDYVWPSGLPENFG